MMMLMMMGGSEVGNVTSFYGVYKSSAQMTFCLCITKMWPKLSTYKKRKYMYENKVKMIVVDRQTTDPQQIHKHAFSLKETLQRDRVSDIC